MPRLQADADPGRWVPVTDSLGFRGRRHRKAAIRMLLAHANRAAGAPERRGGVFAWLASQAMPFLMRRAEGRVLAWVWRADPELLVALAQIQEATPDLRTARAMMPMEYNDTEDFRQPYLGTGEKLVIDFPADTRTPPFAMYTWDTGTHLVTLTAVCSERERVNTVIAAVDEIARTLRVVEDGVIAESGPTLRLDPGAP